MADRKRAAALDRALATMFRMLEKRPVPSRLRTTLEQLEGARPAPNPPEAEGPEKTSKKDKP